MDFQWRSLQRIWQPQRGIFWLMVVLNVTSSLLIWYVHLAQPVAALRWLLGMLALCDAALGW
jgi:hypothetical protein